jgi:antitoxin (DNA-binding transcriptional repressor) of toxin-antitoxin stability system
MKVIREIEHGSALNITFRGKVVAKLVPPGNNRKKIKNKLKKISKSVVLKDIVSPIEANWEALNNDNS